MIFGRFREYKFEKHSANNFAFFINLIFIMIIIIINNNFIIIEKYRLAGTL